MIFWPTTVERRTIADTLQEACNLQWQGLMRSNMYHTARFSQWSENNLESFYTYLHIRPWNKTILISAYIW